MKKILLMTGILIMMISVAGCLSTSNSESNTADIRADEVYAENGAAALYKAAENFSEKATEDNIAEILAGVSDMFKNGKDFANASEVNLISQTFQTTAGGDKSTDQTTSGPETPIDVSVPTGTDAITALVDAGAAGVTKGLADGQNAGLADGQNESDAAANPNCPDGNCSD